MSYLKWELSFLSISVTTSLLKTSTILWYVTPYNCFSLSLFCHGSIIKDGPYHRFYFCFNCLCQPYFAGPFTLVVNRFKVSTALFFLQAVNILHTWDFPKHFMWDFYLWSFYIWCFYLWRLISHCFEPNRSFCGRLESHC